MHVPAVGAGEERLARVGLGDEVVEAEGVLVGALKLLQVFSRGIFRGGTLCLSLFGLLNDGLVATDDLVNVP